MVTPALRAVITPIAADRDWRGPLMPGSKRYFVTSRRALPVFSADQLKTEIEITDIRVWNSEKGTLLEKSPPEEEPPDPNAAAPAANQ